MGTVPYFAPVAVRGDRVELVDLTGIELREPFFEQTVRRALRQRRATRDVKLDDLEGDAVPDAFIFHTSRCGSTLLARLLGTLPGAVVVSEAPVVDDVLRTRRPEHLRAVVGALAPRGARRFFVKLDCWAARDADVVREAFPESPFVVVTRDPAEVLASQLREPSLATVPGMLDLGVDPGLPREEYCATALAVIYEALAGVAGIVVDYRDLPGAIDRVLDALGIPDGERDRAALERVAGEDAKRPGVPYERLAC